MKFPYLVFWVTVADAIRLHAMAIARFGGAAGIRDIGLLASALDQPQKAIEYGEDKEKEIEYLAATYFFHVIKNHAFVDGNKRTGVLVTTRFLEINGFLLEMDFDTLYQLALDVAESRIKDKKEIAKLLHTYLKPFEFDDD
jgi:death-on-curing protein